MTPSFDRRGQTGRDLTDRSSSVETHQGVPHGHHSRHRRRRPYRRRQAQRKAVGLASDRPRGRGAEGAPAAQRPRSGAGRRRDHGLRLPSGRTGAEHRPQRRARGRAPRFGAGHFCRSAMWIVATGSEPRAQRRARCRLARDRAGHHDRPAVWVVAAIGPFRRPRGDGRRLRHRGRCGRRGDDDHADGRVDDPGIGSVRAVGVRAVRPSGRARAPRNLGRAHRRQVEPVARRPRPVRRAVAAASGRCSRRRPFRQRDHPAQGPAVGPGEERGGRPR